MFDPKVGVQYLDLPNHMGDVYNSTQEDTSKDAYDYADVQHPHIYGPLVSWGGTLSQFSGQHTGRSV